MDPGQERTATSLGLTWSAPDTYSAPLRLASLHYEEANQGSWVPWTRLVPAAERRAEIGGLRPNTAFRFRLRVSRSSQR